MKTRRTAATALTCAGVLTTVTLAATLAVIQPGAAAPARTDHTETYRIPFSSFTHNFVGAEEKHPALGDRSIDAFKIASKGHVVGSGFNTCTVVQSHARSVRAQCVSTFLLSHGEVDALTSPGNGHGPKTTMALVGGTGRYAGASGTVVTVPGKTSVQLTLRY